MNLQEILNYRNECIHCGRPMIMKIKGYPKLTTHVSNEGLRIRSGHKNGVYLFFGYDGTYVRNKRDYEIHKRPIIIHKRCNFHPMRSDNKLLGTSIVNLPPGPIKLKSRSTGMTTMASAIQTYYGTTLESMKDVTCQYDFMLFGDSYGNYDCKLNAEFVYHHNDEEFWHIDTYFSSNSTTLYHSRFDATVEQAVQASLKLPAMNLQNTKNIEQFLSKLRLYTLFS